MINSPKSLGLNPFNAIHILATVFGSGLFKKAPGTIGTITAAALWWFLSILNLPTKLFILFIAIMIGVWVCHLTSKDLNAHDHPCIVWDELCGYWLTMILSPQSLLYFIYGFLLFRIFDIFKPWPIKWFDKHLHGGFGIMFDDLLAGILSLMVIIISTALYQFLFLTTV